jgi:hypothetical protein
MKKTKAGPHEGRGGPSPSHLLDARIAALGDWRGATLARVRSLIRQADPDVVEEVKWRGVPVWEHDGIICTGEAYRWPYLRDLPWRPCGLKAATTVSMGRNRVRLSSGYSMNSAHFI